MRAREFMFKESDIITDDVKGIDRDLQYRGNGDADMTGTLPLSASELVKNYRFNDKDKKYLANKNYDSIVIKKLANVPFDLYIYLHDNEKTKDIETASTTPSRKYSFFVDLLDKNGFDEVSSLGMLKAYENFMYHPEAVHLLIAHNDPYSENHQLLTPWMILHRLAHACLDYGQKAHVELKGLDAIHFLFWKLKDFIRFNRMKLKRVFNFKSAEIKGILDDEEILMEMFVKYLYSGKKPFLKYTPISSNTKSKNAELDRTVNDFNQKFSELFDVLIDQMKSKIWVG